jgi:DNA-3-methyladenine glycosylase
MTRRSRSPGRVDISVRRRSLVVDVAALRAARLGRAWFARDALRVARALIGCFIVYEAGEGSDGGGDVPRAPRVSRIVETEALFGEEGHAYVFFIYGMHECFNVTCSGVGSGHAVLVRAGEPTSGFEAHARLDGPGRFARAMGLSRAHDGQDLTVPPIYVCGRMARPRIAVTPRVGVAYAGEWADRPWRFYDPSSPHVSKPPKKAIGRGSP